MTPSQASPYAGAAGIDFMPETFVAALEWPVLHHLRSPETLGLTKSEAQRAVHAAQSTRIYSRFEANESVVAAAEILAVETTRAGAVLGTRVTVEHPDGRRLSETDHVHIYRGVDVLGENRRFMEWTPPAHQASATDLDWTVMLDVRHDLPRRYSEATGIYAPIHTDMAMAKALGFPDVILHGTSTLALAVNALMSDTYNRSSQRIDQFSCRYRAPAFPGRRMTLHHDNGWGVVHFEVRRDDGLIVLDRGQITHDHTVPSIG